jgi:SSS family solute:Na+ symporter
VIGITVTTIVWVVITFMTKPVDKKTLISFIKTVQPSGPGWKKILDQARADGEIIDTNIVSNNFPLGIACMVAGCFAIYGALFATGYWIYSQYVLSTLLALVSVVSSSRPFSSFENPQRFGDSDVMSRVHYDGIIPRFIETILQIIEQWLSVQAVY